MLTTTALTRPRTEPIASAEPTPTTGRLGRTIQVYRPNRNPALKNYKYGPVWTIPQYLDKPHRIIRNANWRQLPPGPAPNPALGARERYRMKYYIRAWTNQIILYRNDFNQLHQMRVKNGGDAFYSFNRLVYDVGKIFRDLNNAAIVVRNYWRYFLDPNRAMSAIRHVQSLIRAAQRWDAPNNPQDVLPGSSVLLFQSWADEGGHTHLPNQRGKDVASGTDGAQVIFNALQPLLSEFQEAFARLPRI